MNVIHSWGKAKILSSRYRYDERLLIHAITAALQIFHPARGSCRGSLHATLPLAGAGRDAACEVRRARGRAPVYMFVEFTLCAAAAPPVYTASD